MSKVYFKEFVADSSPEMISGDARCVLAELIKQEQIELKGCVPLKVHFGEKGNHTYIRSEHYLGIIDYLKEQQLESAFIESNVLYAGKRSNRKDHEKTAEDHGFTQLPIIIADGDTGEDYTEIEINKNHFKTCRIAKAFADYDQYIVLSHFKGHRMAGFGGAMKQLAMGFASRAGKMDQHANSKPFTIPCLCSKCGACIKYCPKNAMTMGWLRPKIDKERCTGCAGCVGICRRNAIIPNFLASFNNKFIERMVEYAYAAQLGKQVLYISLAMNMTKYCDCEGWKMKAIAPNLGIIAGTDPVAVDQASLDMVDKTNNRMVYKKGRHALGYAEGIGLGSRQYELIQL